MILSRHDMDAWVKMGARAVNNVATAIEKHAAAVENAAKIAANESSRVAGRSYPPHSDVD